MSPQERTYGGRTVNQLGGDWKTGDLRGLDALGPLLAHIRELQAEVAALRAERPSSEELASLKAERDKLRRLLTKAEPILSTAHISAPVLDPAPYIAIHAEVRAALSPKERTDG